MGAYFKLEHANIVAYVTSRSYGVPRIRRLDLDDGVSGMPQVREADPSTTPDRKPLVSSRLPPS